MSPGLFCSWEPSLLLQAVSLMEHSHGLAGGLQDEALGAEDLVSTLWVLEGIRVFEHTSQHCTGLL